MRSFVRRSAPSLLAPRAAPAAGAQQIDAKPRPGLHPRTDPRHALHAPPLSPKAVADSARDVAPFAIPLRAGQKVRESSDSALVSALRASHGRAYLILKEAMAPKLEATGRWGHTGAKTRKHPQGVDSAWVGQVGPIRAASIRTAVATLADAGVVFLGYHPVIAGLYVEIRPEAAPALRRLAFVESLEAERDRDASSARRR